MGFLELDSGMMGRILTSGKYTEFFRTLKHKDSERLVIISSVPPRLISDYCKLLPYNTTIVNIGLGSKPRDFKLNIDMGKALFNRLTVTNSFSVPSLYFDQAVQYLSDGTIDRGLFEPNIIKPNELLQQLKITGTKTFAKTIVDWS